MLNRLTFGPRPETLRMEPWEILKDYSPQRMTQMFTPLSELLPGDQMRKGLGMGWPWMKS